MYITLYAYNIKQELQSVECFSMLYLSTITYYKPQKEEKYKKKKNQYVHSW